ncbi:hypothetical protein IFR05_016207 [Cadophora sp. M221]|nr:hypothetical protein IFR05_016207 [Cadophora sp. M221]
MHNNPLSPLFLAILTFFSLNSIAGHVIERDTLPAQLKLRASKPQVQTSMSRAGHGGRFGLSPTTSVHLGQAWYTPIQVGGKTYKLLVDTGSSDTWIATKDFEYFDESGVILQADCAFDPLYDPGRELEPIKDVNFNIFYGDGAVLRGSYGMARVTLAGIA